jgi:hypothetical protein
MRPVLCRTDREREVAVRRLFERFRKSHPSWRHYTLLNYIWPRRPEGTGLDIMEKVAAEFRLSKIGRGT